MSVPEDCLGPRRAGRALAPAAAVPVAGMTALPGLRDVGQLRPDQAVLIVGASGGVGTLAVQLAKHFGANVTGVCSTRNLTLVRSLGADQVIDYTRNDVTRMGSTYDLIFQLAGTTSPGALRRILTPSGRLVLSSGDSPGRLVGPMKRMAEAVILSAFASQTLRPLTTKRSRQDLEHLKSLIEGGRVTPVIERTYPLSASAAAVRHLETGHVRGKLTISVQSAEPAHHALRSPASADPVPTDEPGNVEPGPRTGIEVAAHGNAGADDREVAFR